MKCSVFFAIIIAVLCFTSCNNTKSPEEKITVLCQDLEDEEVVTEKDADYKSVVYIDSADAVSLSKAFNNKIRSRIGLNTGRTSAVWFEKKVIKELYDALYNDAKKDRLDGVRIYYGRYPKNYKDSKRAGMLTTFLLLTKPGRYPNTHNDTFYFKKPALWNIMSPVEQMSLNHGELCPDVCDSIYNFRKEY